MMRTFDIRHELYNHGLCTGLMSEYDLMKRYIIAILVILGITNAILYQQLTYAISVDVGKQDVRLSNEDFWNTFGPLFKQSINGTIGESD
jgi:hypothetical protein